MDGAAPDSSLHAGAIVFAFALVIANAFFVAAEYAYVRIRPSRLRALADAGGRRAAMALRLVERIDDTISVCQVGVTICSLGLGFLGEPAFAAAIEWLLARGLAPLAGLIGRHVNAVALATSFAVVTFLLVVVGELLPKRMSLVFTERIALLFALPLRSLGIAFRPVVWVLSGSARLLGRALRLPAADDEGGHSREEIRALLAVSVEAGQFKDVEVELLDNLFRFAQRRARDAMVPRRRVAVLDLRRPIDEILQRVRQEGYSRYPLVDGDFERLVGVVLAKEMLPALAARPTAEELRRIARPPVIVPETLSLERLLQRFRAERAHLAVVADEYGGLVGIVTLEDVLEELVGELRDEFDIDEQDPVRALPDGRGYALDPALAIDRAAELIELEPPEAAGVHTLAGLMQAELGRLPRTGDRIDFGDRHELVAAAVQGTQILRIELVAKGV